MTLILCSFLFNFNELNPFIMNLFRPISKLYYRALGVVLIFSIGCQQRQTSPERVSDEDFKQLPKIDVHAHYKYPRAYLPDFFERWNMKAMLVDVAIEQGDSIVKSFDAYLAHYNQLPELFYLCTTFTAHGIENADYADTIIAQLEQDIAHGARMVKVWKNFGMVTKDTKGNFIQINDPRLNPIWDFLAKNKITVLAHIADPEQAWRPLEDPNNPHYNYYKNNPQYHAYNFPEMPSYETILAARDQWIKNNPELKIIAAHILSMSNNINAVSERLDAYPNLSVELGARFGDLAMQDSEKVKQFFYQYQDRILFGTDYGTSQAEAEKSAEALVEEAESLEERYRLLFDYLVKEDSMELRKQQTKGLGLSKEVLEKVFSTNYLTFLADSN
jgi:predicted TIM-barrel fold metal-dependent hydrolase